MDAQHASLEEQRAQVHAHRLELQAALEDERQKFIALEAQFRGQQAQWQDESRALRQALDAARIELERAQTQGQQHETRAQALVAERDAMLASRSWRWTALVRAISSRARGLARP